MEQFKKSVYKIPVLRKGISSVLFFVRLPRKILTLQKQLNEMHQELATQREALENSHVLFAENHLLDNFYARFEDRFRGGEHSVLERLKDYEQDFLKAPVDFSAHPVIDIGCGRGEFLQYMNSLGVRARGIDMNEEMVARVRGKGFEAEQGDAVKYLTELKEATAGAITGFHIAEHVPFDALLQLITAAHRALTKGGFLLLETPNPENFFVATNTFNLDPSHLKPLPPELLAFAFEVVGFTKVEIRRLHPTEDRPKAKLEEPLDTALYGSRDYAVIGTK